MWNRHSRDFYVPGGRARGYLYPQLVVPTDQPKNFVCPREHIDQATMFIQDCQGFLVIGFSGRDEDVVGLLRNARNDARWVIVSCGDARSIFERLGRQGGSGTISGLDARLFTTWVLQSLSMKELWTSFSVGQNEVVRKAQSALQLREDCSQLGWICL